MRNLKNYVSNHKYVLLLLYWPIQCIWYEALRIFTAGAPVVLYETALDKAIPFCEWFILPYICWYPYVLAVSVLGLCSSKRDFMRTQFLLIGCMLLPSIYCTIVPNGIPLSLRPDFATLGRDNILIDLVKLIYAVDSPPRNCMPSMHVSLSLGLFFAVAKNETLKGKWGIKAFCGVLTVLICMATVLIKQHSVLDVYGGVAVALLVFIIVTVLEKKKVI